MSRSLTLQECIDGTEDLWREAKIGVSAWAEFLPPVVLANWDKLPREAKWAAWCTADRAESRAP